MESFDFKFCLPFERMSLESQPRDVIYVIAKDLSSDQVARLCQTSRRFASICSDMSFWAQRAYEDFRSPQSFFMKTTLPAITRYRQVQSIHHNPLKTFLTALAQGDIETMRYLVEWDPERVKARYPKHHFSTYNLPPPPTLLPPTTRSSSRMTPTLPPPPTRTMYPNLLPPPTQTRRSGPVKTIIPPWREPFLPRLQSLIVDGNNQDELLYALETAIKNGHRQSVIFVYDKFLHGYGPFYREMIVRTAAAAGETEIVEYIIDKLGIFPANHIPNYRVDLTVTASRAAARAGQLQTLQSLLSRYASLFDSGVVQLPIRSAAAGGHLPTVDYLVSLHGENAEPAMFVAPLAEAMLNSHNDVVDYFLDKGVVLLMDPTAVIGVATSYPNGVEMFLALFDEYEPSSKDLSLIVQKALITGEIPALQLAVDLGAEGSDLILTTLSRKIGRENRYPKELARLVRTLLDKAGSHYNKSALVIAAASGDIDLVTTLLEDRETQQHVVLNRALQVTSDPDVSQLLQNTIARLPK